MTEFVDNLDFKNVKIDTENTEESHLIIDFKLSDEYNFFFNSINSISKKERTIHHYFLKDIICPFCQEKIRRSSQNTCPTLTKYVSDIESFLLNHPNIRLRRLFL